MNALLISSGFSGMARDSFPTVIVSQLDGAKILSLLNEHNDNVLAQLGEQNWAKSEYVIMSLPLLTSNYFSSVIDTIVSVPSGGQLVCHCRC